MLYQWYETQRALVSPFADFALAASRLYSNQLSPFATLPGAHRLSAAYELLNRLTKNYEKPEFRITSVTVCGTEVAVQEHVVLTKPFCRLLRFKRFTDNAELLQNMRDQPVVLVVAPLSGHHSTLLRETVRALLKDHKVYITDWTDARMVPTEQGPFHLADYVHYVQEFIRLAGPEVNVISVCQPTVPVLAAISLMASKGEPTPRTMTMMGGPIDARKSPTAVNNLAMNKSVEWFERKLIYRVPVNYPGEGRRVYPGFMQHTGFIAMNPSHHMKSHYDFFLNLVRGDDDNIDTHRNFYDEYNAVLDMPAEYYLDTIKTVFQEYGLVHGTWKIEGQLVRPQDITTTALLTIEGELDDISGAGQTKAAHDLCTGIPEKLQFHHTALNVGHYGIFSGSKWRDRIYPIVRDFIHSHHSSLAQKEAKNTAKPMPVTSVAPRSGPKAVTTPNLTGKVKATTSSASPPVVKINGSNKKGATLVVKKTSPPQKLRSAIAPPAAAVLKKTNRSLKK
jgi:poly(3-hydroxybutyrate) depolymerase